MPGIIRAEYLSYYSAARNSDKLFNVFLIEETDGTFSCLTENGRRGSNLVRRTLCSKTGRATAESKFRQKLDEKRYHRQTPYTNEVFGANYSLIAREYSSNQSQSERVSANPIGQLAPAAGNGAQPNNKNVIAFPIVKKEKKREQPKQTGILNHEQFDSLEI
jgi:hypothetical protein